MAFFTTPHQSQNRIITAYIFGLLFLFTACRGGGKESDANGSKEVLAEVYNKKLYAYEVQDYIPDNISGQDSLQIVRAFVEQWVKEALLLVEAERSVSQDLEIDRLVKDYRASLIIANYEQKLVEERLDTTVNESEITAYYQDNKQQYQLEYTIMRCRFMKINQTITPKGKDFIDKNWRSDTKRDMNQLQKLCKEFGEVCYFDEKQWHKFDHIKSFFPQGVLNEGFIRGNQEFTFRDNQYYYYLKVLERFSSQELAPISFIEEQAKKYILHRRKLALIQQIKESLYEREITGKDVRIHVQ
jgi:hypothetical protein